MKPEESEIVCPICLGALEPFTNRATLRCGHVLHTTCLIALAQTSILCPCCRAPYAELPAPAEPNDNAPEEEAAADSDSESDLEFSDAEDVVNTNLLLAAESPALTVIEEPPPRIPQRFTAQIVTRSARVDLFYNVYGSLYHAEATENFRSGFYGLTVSDISADIPEFDIHDIRNMVYSMCEDGHLYTTCDEDHFRLTDAR